MSHVEGMQAVTVHVEDFDRAREFYRDGLDLEEVDVNEEGGFAAYHVPGASPIGIHRWADCEDTGGRPPGTVTGVILTVDDAHAFADRVAKTGGELTEPVEELPWGPLGGVVADEDGNEFAFSEPPEQ